MEFTVGPSSSYMQRDIRSMTDEAGFCARHLKGMYDYGNLLGDALILQDLGGEDIRPTFHLYKLLVNPEKAGGDVQLLKQKLEKRGVTNIPHFGPLYRFNIMQTYGYDEDAIAETCPNCEEVFYRRFTHFPVYGLSKEQVDYMADAILDSVQEMQRGL